LAEPFRLDGKVALVTGASRGIGRAIALELGRAGARVGVHYRAARELADEVVRAIDPDGRKGAAALPADLRRPGDAASLVSACRERLGPIAILVNNAGIWNGMPIDRFDEDRLEELLNLNLKAVFRLTSQVVPDMRELGWGRIVNVSSTAGLLGEPGHAHYAASKGALETFTRSLAVELGRDGITTNSVAPGWTLTEMTRAELDTERVRKITSEIPTGRIATPEDVASAVRYLASEEARQVNGTTIPVEGGYRFRR